MKKKQGESYFLVMARYELHPIGHDGSIEMERWIGPSMFLLDVQSACVVGSSVGRSLNESPTYIRKGRGGLFFLLRVCVFLVYVL